MFHRSQGVEVICTVQGALIQLNGHPVGTGTHDLEVGVDHTFTASAPGFKPRTVVVKGKDDMAVRYLVMDLLWVLLYGTGIVFIIVDLATGCMWDLSPREVDLNLER